MTINKKLFYLCGIINLFLLQTTLTQTYQPKRYTKYLENKLNELNKNQQKLESDLSESSNIQSELENYLGTLQLPADISIGLGDIINQKNESLKKLNEQIKEVNQALIGAKNNILKITNPQQENLYLKSERLKNDLKDTNLKIEKLKSTQAFIKSQIISTSSQEQVKANELIQTQEQAIKSLGQKKDRITNDITATNNQIKNLNIKP